MRHDPYEQALLRLLEVPSSPRLGLERMEALLWALGEPQLRFVSLHVAGTNGKGSTCAFLDAALGAQGVRRGLTTSPHLTSATERIQIDGRPVSRERFVALEAEVARAASALEDPPTFFERVLSMAFLAFAEAGVEVAVVEVGLGGRLDASNVLSPEAAGITRLGLDHQAFLGDTLEAIASEKAGIVKSGVPAVSVRQDPGAEVALRARARAVDAPLRFLEEQDLGRLSGLELGLKGAHQRENAALALALLEAAGRLSSPKAAQRGLAEARWPGRFEAVAEAPLVLLDGAHNPLGAATLAAALEEDVRARGRPLSLVLGMTRGHEGAAFARALARLPIARALAVRARAPRSRPAEEVARELAEGGLLAAVRSSPSAALEEARAHAAKEGGVVVVTGSLYLVGELRARLIATPEDPVLPQF